MKSDASRKIINFRFILLLCSVSLQDVVDHSSPRHPIFVALSDVYIFTIPPTHFSNIHSRKLFMSFIRCFPMFFYFYIVSVCVKVSKPSSLIMFPRNFCNIFLILNKRVIIVSIFLPTSALFTWNVYGDLSLLL